MNSIIHNPCNIFAYYQLFRECSLNSTWLAMAFPTVNFIQRKARTVLLIKRIKQAAFYFIYFICEEEKTEIKYEKQREKSRKEKKGK